MAISRRGWLCLLVLGCFAVCIYSQNITCGSDTCPGDRGPGDDGELPDQCCSRYIAFVNGCCTSSENSRFRLIRDVVIGVSVGIVGLIIILFIICVCCCCCVCCE